MFTGIVRELGRVTAVDGGRAGIQLKLEAPRTASGVSVGDSVAIDGCCLTVTSVNGSTLAETTLGAVARGDQVNLEVDVLAKYVERLLAPRGR